MLTSAGYIIRKTKGSHIILQRGSNFLNLQRTAGGKAKAYQVRQVRQELQKSESQTMMKTAMQPDPRDYEIRIWYSAEKGDECFAAQVVEWSSIMAHGDTREEAAREIQRALEGALEAATERGIKPPAPALARAS